MHESRQDIIQLVPLTRKRGHQTRVQRWTGPRQLRHHRSVETKCAQCGAAMTCQPEDGCWCVELPRVPMPTTAEGCLCPNCLRAKIAALQKTSEKKEA